MSYHLSDLVRDFPDHQIPPNTLTILDEFFKSYQEGVYLSDKDQPKVREILKAFTALVYAQFKNPFEFELFHKAIRTPVDYYQFGLDLIRLLIDFDSSSVLGHNYVDEIEQYLQRGENVILLANHQIEADPQVISLLLETTHPKLAEEMIFVAGHRVTTDPLAVPFSMGCNLLCIYSKKYINHPPSEKYQKMVHNQKTLKKLEELLEEGGHCIYVAPSGGRDRPNSQGVVEVSPFEPQNVELFYLISSLASKKTHFYPLAINSFHLLPPPSIIQKHLGEQRLVKSGPAHIGFGSEIDMNNFPGSNSPLKRERRQMRTDHTWELVKKIYSKLEE